MGGTLPFMTWILANFTRDGPGLGILPSAENGKEKVEEIQNVNIETAD